MAQELSKCCNAPITTESVDSDEMWAEMPLPREICSKCYKYLE